jgi:hypothetical protein
MTKRSRESTIEVAQLVVKPETVCAMILEHTKTWKDRCGCLYFIDSKMTLSKDHIVLKVGFFDEIQCTQILDLSALTLPGNYVIRSVSCDMEKQAVVFTITKSTKSARQADVEPAAAARADGDLLRLRALYDVKEADAPAVQAALASVTGASEGCQLLRCAHRPGMYVLYISQPRSGFVTSEALVAAAKHCGVVDFENKQIVISVDKKQSDIF